MSLLVALSVETSYGTESHLFLKTKLSGKTSKTHLRKAHALPAFFFLIQRIKAVDSQYICLFYIFGISIFIAG